MPGRRALAGLALAALVCAATAAAAAEGQLGAKSAPTPLRVAPGALCRSAAAQARAGAQPDIAVLAAYAPFPDPGKGIAHTLLPLISLRPRTLDKWVRSADLYCAVTPDAPGGANGVVLPSPALVLPAASLPHINSHGKATMAAFHWCKLDAKAVEALHGRGGTVRLVDAAEAAVLRGTGFDRGHEAALAATPLGDAVPGTELVCEGGVPFPAPLRKHGPPPALVAALAAEDGADDGILVTRDATPASGRARAAAKEAAAVSRALPPPPPRSYETLAACVGPLYGSSADGLVAWFEHHLAAGLDAVYAYVVVDEEKGPWAPGANPVHAVLAHYAQSGVATILDWSPVGGAASPWAADAWYFNQPALHNDCLNRVRGKHRHAVFLDTDEFVEAGGWHANADAAVAAAAAAAAGERVDDGGSLAKAVTAWAASPVYEATHSVTFPGRWRAMLGDASTRAQRGGGGEGGGSVSAPNTTRTVLAASAIPALADHPPLAPSSCAEPLIDRLPYRSAKVESQRSKFVARPDATLAVEAHFVLVGAGREADFEADAVWHNHYFIMRDGVAAHPTAPRPRRPGANASAPGGGLQIPVPGMMEVEDAGWPARFVATGLRDRVAAVAAVACAGF
jgi:hypothetical protein